MATIGLNNFRYAKLLNPESTGDPLYDEAKSPGKAISCNVEIENYDAELYADDVLVESDKSFKNGTATVTIDDENLETAADLLGHTFQDGRIIRKADDNAPYVGFGRIVMKLVNNVRKYKVEFLYKVKFGEPSVENQTKGEDIEFDTMELEGKVTALLNGKWSTAKEFNSKEDARTFLEGLMGNGATLTYDVNGGTGSIAPVTAAKGSSINLNDGTGLTAPEGKGLLGWGSTAETTTPDITSPYTITENKTIYAIWTNLVTLTYDPNDGTGSIAPVVKPAGSNITLSDGTGLTAPEGKGLLGWGSTAGTTTPDITSPYTITENKTIYAIWTNLVTLTYDSNGGTGSIDSVTKPAGSAITLSDGTGLTPPSNKVFGGWGTSSSSTTAVTSPYNISSNTTLYAIWNNA